MLGCEWGFGLQGGGLYTWQQRRVREEFVGLIPYLEESNQGNWSCVHFSGQYVPKCKLS